MGEEGTEGAQGASTTTEPLAGSGAAEGVQTAQVPPAEGTQQTEPDKFDRAYVEQLRQEAAGYRTKAKEFEDAFSAYSPEERAAMLDIARGLATPEQQRATAERLQKIANSILKDEGKTPRRPTGEEDPDQRPMTRAEWKAEQARIQEEQAQAQAMAAIAAEAEELGYVENTPEHALLMLKALDPDVSGDLKKAHEKVQEHYTKKAQEIAERKAAAGERWPGVVSNTGAAGAADVEGGPTTDWKAARMGALAYIKAQAGKVSG